MDNHIDSEVDAHASPFGLGYTEKDDSHRRTLPGSVLQGECAAAWKQCGLERQILAFPHPPSATGQSGIAGQVAVSLGLAFPFSKVDTNTCLTKMCEQEGIQLQRKGFAVIVSV